MQRTLAILMLVGVMSGLVACATTAHKVSQSERPDYGPTPDKPFVIRLMAVNDLHGHLTSPSGTFTVDGEKVPTGGGQALANLVKKTRQEYPKAIFVAAGDMIGASPLLSGAFHDEPTVEALNQMKLDVTSVGNHEFDEGVDELLRIKQGGCHPVDGCQGKESYDGADFDLLAANVVKKPTSEGVDPRLVEPILPATTIKVVDGVPVGFIGLTLQGTAKVVSPKHASGYQFLDEVETINRYVKQLQEKGVEAIVVLIHEGALPQGDDFNSCNDATGPLVDIVNQLDRAVDLVVSGHTHQAYICEFNGILTTSAKSYGRLLTQIDLTVDPKSRDVIKRLAVNQPVLVEGGGVKSDIDAIVQRYDEIVKPLEYKVVGRIRGDITRQPDRNGESPLGRLIADAQLAAAQPEGAQIAMMNPGGIRGDLLYNKESSDPNRAAGVVTYGDVFGIQPFSNYLVTMTLTGQQIKDILEQQFKNQKLLSVSKGFSYTYDPEAQEGERILPKTLKLNGKPLDLKKNYRVVANHFLAEGGDEFPTFTKGTDRIVGMLDLDALTLYLGKQRSVAPSKDRRLRKK